MKNTDELLTRLLMATIGSCTCMTKTPVLEQHKDHCKYKNIQSAYNYLKFVKDKGWID